MAEPSHWLWVGCKRVSKDDKLPGSYHPRCLYKPISGTAMELSVYTFLRYPRSSDQNKQTNKQNSEAIMDSDIGYTREYWSWIVNLAYDDLCTAYDDLFSVWWPLFPHQHFPQIKITSFGRFGEMFTDSMQTTRGVGQSGFKVHT